MDIIVDLETLGIGEDSIIVQVGAIKFNRNTGERLDSFLKNISINTSIAAGFKLETEVYNWWMEQNKKVRASVFNNKNKSVREVMVELNNFIKGADAIWSHATFDFPKIMYHLKALGIPPSFSFRSARDLRTIVDISKLDLGKIPKNEMAHNALVDCEYQLEYLIEGLNKFKNI